MGEALTTGLPIASHWAASGGEWIIVLAPLYVLSAAMAGWWLARRQRRRRRAVREGTSAEEEA